MPSKDTGLAAIARSMRAVANSNRAPNTSAAEAHPLLVFDGRSRKTSLTFDVGLWDCVLETAHVLSKHTRSTGQGRVTISDVLVASLITFHELPLEQKLHRLSRASEVYRRRPGVPRHPRDA